VTDRQTTIHAAIGEALLRAMPRITGVIEGDGPEDEALALVANNLRLITQSADPEACSWRGSGPGCVDPVGGLWELVDPPGYFAENIGPKVRSWCAIHGAELEKVGWVRLPEAASDAG
jgi:hypothetical protein